MMEEHAIGEIFTYKGQKLMVVESQLCIDCYFRGVNTICKFPVGNCNASCRSDNKFVLYKLIPFKFGK